MTIQTAGTLYLDNGTNVDTGAGIDVRFLNASNPGVADSTQTASFSHTNDNVERTFDPATAAVTNTNNAGTTLFRTGWALRLSQDMTPTDDTNCNAALVAQTITVTIRTTATQSGGTYASGTFQPTFRASLWEYDPTTDAGTLIGAGSSNTTTWNVAAVGGDLGTTKTVTITITLSALWEFTQGRVLLLQLGLNTGTVPNPTLGTGAFIQSVTIADPTDPTTVVFGTSGIRTLCASTGTATTTSSADGVSGLVKPGAGSSLGVATVSGVSGATKGSAGTATAGATVSGVSAAVKGGTGSAAGAATVSGVAASVKGGTGTVNVAGGGGTTIIKPVFVFDD